MQAKVIVISTFLRLVRLGIVPVAIKGMIKYLKENVSIRIYVRFGKNSHQR